jgi:predicted HAD superfamily Cof-like phosphohydrolase
MTFTHKDADPYELPDMAELNYEAQRSIHVGNLRLTDEFQNARNLVEWDKLSDDEKRWWRIGTDRFLKNLLAVTPKQAPELSILDGTEKFMRAAGQLDTTGLPEDRDDSLRSFRRELLKEEYTEYRDGEFASDAAEIADGLLDTIVVAWGTMLAYFGPELAKALAGSVSDSNLSKIKEDGTVIKREDGKVLKPDTYVKPRIPEILQEAGFRLTPVAES